VRENTYFGMAFMKSAISAASPLVLGQYATISS